MLEQLGDPEKLLQILATYRRNLAHYLRQAAEYGGINQAPVSTSNGIYKTKVYIYQYANALHNSGLVTINIADDDNVGIIVKQAEKEKVTYFEQIEENLFQDALISAISILSYYQAVFDDDNIKEWRERIISIKNQLLYEKRYAQLKTFRESQNWKDLLYEHGKFAHLKHLAANEDPEKWIYWARCTKELIFGVAKIEFILSKSTNEHVYVQVIEQCRELNDKLLKLEEHFDIKSNIKLSIQNRMSTVLKKEAIIAKNKKDLHRAIYLLLSAREYAIDQELIDDTVRVLKKYVHEHIINSLNFYQSLYDNRQGVVSLYTIWSDNLEIPQPDKYEGNSFRVSCYPVTVWQYKQFLYDNGYNEDYYWTIYGIKWRDFGERTTEPRGWSKERFSGNNQPIVGVCWYEAAAFCKWLTGRHRAWGLLGYAEEIRLPTLDEWKLAASQDPKTKEKVQWVDKPYIIKRNYKEALLDSPSPVGMFYDNVSPCGAYDMAGNVWEWCSSGTNQGVTQELPCMDFDPEEDYADVCGGSYRSVARDASWTSDSSKQPGDQELDCGFRLCRSPICITSTQTPG